MVSKIQDYEIEWILGGGGSMEEGKYRSRKTVELGGSGGIDIKFVTIAM